MNPLDHDISVSQHVAIPESQHGRASADEVSGSQHVMLGSLFQMLCAVDLDESTI
jgi:hypothetical protein